MAPWRANLVKDVRDEKLRYVLGGGKGLAPASRLRSCFRQGRTAGSCAFGFERGDAELFDCVTVL